MKKHWLFIIAFLGFAAGTTAQSAVNLLLLGNEHFRSKTYSKAVPIYQASIAKNPHSFAAVYNLGSTYYELKNYTEAAKCYNASKKLAKTHGEFNQLYFNLGNTYRKSQEWEKATVAYITALKYNPNDEEARYNLAIAQKGMKSQKTPHAAPSAFAKMVKKKADILSGEGNFAAAYELMKKNERVDSTMSHFKTYTDKLGQLANIK